MCSSLPCHWLLMACFADIINVSQGSVATYARCGGIFNIHLTANLPRNLPVKNFLNRLRFDRSMAMSLCPWIFMRSCAGGAQWERMSLRPALGARSAWGPRGDAWDRASITLRRCRLPPVAAGSPQRRPVLGVDSRERRTSASLEHRPQTQP